MAQVILQNPAALWLLPLLWLLIVLFAWRRRFKPFGPFLLRLFIVVLLVFALAQPTLTPPTSAEEETPQEKLVVLVDQSASLGEVGQQALRDEADRLTNGLDDAVVLYFADQAVWVTTPSPAVETEEQNTKLNPETSNLAESLLLGSELLTVDDQPGRLVLLSDGIPTTGNTQAAIDHLVENGVAVDTLIVDENTRQSWYDFKNEIRLISLDVPPVLRQGEAFDIEVIIHSEVAAPEATLTLTHPAGQQILAEDTIALEPGLNRFTFSADADEVGPRTYQATITANDDRFSENNSIGAFTQVYATPQILVVADDPAVAAPFATQLQEAGYQVETMLAKDMPIHLSELENYDGMALLDVSARSMELEQMIAIEEFVRSLGRGLVLTAGRNSFALGKYEGTPLAKLLPLSLDPPPREERPPVALLLVIDHSGSMVEERGELATRLVMAKEAAIRATDVLGPEDLIGIMMFDNNFDWVVPFQTLNDGAELLTMQQRVARIPGGGGTRILQALETALPALIEQEGIESRHAVLFSDGKSFDGNRGIDDYNLIVDEALAANITLSTIAIGSDADVDLLAYLAERGHGRYHFADTPEELPALTISESDILRSQAVQEGDFESAIYAPHPVVRGIFSPLPSPDRPEAPSLQGYLAMSPKPEAEVALQVGPGDPLLSVWGYGLGRVAVWSSDTGKEWATSWREWSEFNQFLSQVVGYTLPAPDLGLLQLEAGFGDQNLVTLAADGVTTAGFPVEQARTETLITQPGGEENQLRLQQSGSGRYERTLRLPEAGVYQFTVTQNRNDEPAEVTTAGFMLPYPAEYGLPPENAGRPLLTEIASTTGGDTFSLGQLFGAAATSVEEEDFITEPIEVAWLLLLAALILWPFEIAWRRWARLRIQ